MNRIGDLRRRSNIYQLRPDVSVHSSGGDKNTKSVKPTTRVSAFDRQDVKSAGDLVVNSFQNFLAEPEGSEIFGFVLDGKISDQRSGEQESLLDRVVDFSRGGNHMNDEGPEFVAADFQGATFADNSPLRALTSVSTEGKSKVFLSNALGFRDSILAARDGYADVVTMFAKGVGLDQVEGDVARQLSETVATGEIADTNPGVRAPEEIETTVNGTPTKGIPR